MQRYGHTFFVKCCGSDVNLNDEEALLTTKKDKAAVFRRRDGAMLTSGMKKLRQPYDDKSTKQAFVCSSGRFQENHYCCAKQFLSSARLQRDGESDEVFSYYLQRFVH